MERERKLYLAALGAGQLTYEKAVKLTRKMVETGELIKDSEEEFRKELVKRSKEYNSQLTEKINSVIDDLAKRGETVDQQAREKREDIEKRVKDKVREIMGQMREQTRNEEVNIEVGKEITRKTENLP